jgi:hypothetical protein
MLTMLLAAAVGPAMPRASDPSTAAIDAAERLQDTARLYRNGLRTGAAAVTLERLFGELERELETVEQAHAAWAPDVPEESREAVAIERQAIRDGCRRMHEHLRQLSEALCSDPDDRARMASLAIDVGQQAGRCEKSLRAARRLVMAV